jgi:hypothetical protein
MTRLAPTVVKFSAAEFAIKSVSAQAEIVTRLAYDTLIRDIRPIDTFM